MSKRDKQHVLLLGSYGRGNIGDDAFLLAALQLFKGHQLYINAADESLLPQAVRGKVTTIATTGARDLRHKLQVFRTISHIVYCGGDLWVELYGDRFPRQSLYKMVVVNMLARLCGKKVHYIGCGIGRLRGYSLFLARLSARLANNVIVREQRSARVLNLKKVEVLPDLVTNIDIRKPRKDKAQKGPYTIGISILYHLPDPENNFPKLVKEIGTCIAKLPKNRYRFVLFPMLVSPSEEHDDLWASEALADAVPNADISVFEGREVNEYVQALQTVDVLIGTRLHANIIALMAGVPSIGISYRPKVAQFFEMSGLGEYCIDLKDVTAELLEAKLHAMLSDLTATHEAFEQARQRNIRERQGYQDFVAAQF